MPADPAPHPIVVIPAYRPDAALPQLVSGLAAAPFSIVVVDDGSGPVYEPVFAALPSPAVTILRHETNRGKGAALRTAFLWIAEPRPDASGIVTADADGQHALPDILSVAAALAAEPEALHLGSRPLDGPGVPLRSRLGNLPMRWFFRLCTGLRLADTQTGLRGFSASLAPWFAALPGDRYEFELTMLLAAARLGCPIREHPIRALYRAGNAGSHFRPLRDSWRVMHALFRR